MKNTKILLSVLLIGFLTSGCQDDNNDNINTDNNDDIETVLSSNKITISGVIVDGYLSGATVCLDSNSNDICDTTEPTVISDKSGKYKITFNKKEHLEYATSNILSIGGYDETAKIDFQGKLKSPFIENTKIININPLMDTINDKMENEDISFEEARKKVADSFGINEDDINKDILSNNNTKALETALKIQKFKETLDFLTEAEKIEVINNMNSNINGEVKTVGSIINNIDHSKLNTVKKEIVDTISSISIPNNSTYEEKSIIQQNIEKKKKFLNNIVTKYSATSNTVSFNNNVDNNEFSEIYDTQMQIALIIQEKGDLIVEKLELLGLSDMIINEEFYTLEYKDFLSINFNNIQTLDDLKYEISLTALNTNIKQMFNDIIENKKLENNN
jgi:hypothetical protein